MQKYKRKQQGYNEETNGKGGGRGEGGEGETERDRDYHEYVYLCKLISVGNAFVYPQSYTRLVIKRTTVLPCSTWVVW